MEGPQGFNSVVNVNCDATGLEVAQEVTAVTGIPSKHQLLFCRDKPVYLYQTLKTQNIASGDRIRVCLRVCGGSGREKILTVS